MAESVAGVVVAAAERGKGILAPPRRYRARGWCETEEIATAVKAALHAREEKRRLMSIGTPKDGAKWRVLKTKACILTSNRTLPKWSETLESGDQAGFYKHIKGTVGMEGANADEEQFFHGRR